MTFSLFFIFYFFFSPSYLLTLPKCPPISVRKFQIIKILTSVTRSIISCAQHAGTSKIVLFVYLKFFWIKVIVMWEPSGVFF